MALQARWVDTSYYDYEGEYIQDGYYEYYDDGVYPETGGDDTVDTGGDGTIGDNQSGGGGSDNVDVTNPPKPDFTGGESQDHDNTPTPPTPTPDFTGGESQDHDLTPGEAAAGQGWQQDEIGNWYKLDAAGNLTFKDSKGENYSYDPVKGGFVNAKGVFAGLNTPSGSNAAAFLKNLFSKKDASGKPTGDLDWKRILSLGGAAIATSKAAGAGAGAGKPAGGTTGYQGTVPRYTAARQAPGIGQLLSGNVLYRTADGTVVNPNSNAPSTGIAPPEKPMARGGALESGGFVIPADVVSHVGNGSSEAGLRILAQRFGATPIKGDGDGMSDSIKTTIDGHQPARVANEEARLTKAQVDAAGGAKKLYAMMDKIREARTGTKKQGKKIDPEKFMPGGAVQSYVTGGKTVPAGTVGVESSLSNWAGDYVTDMLAKGQALSELPYEQYKGALTADPSSLQKKVTTGLEGISFPGNLGTSYSNTSAPTIGADGQPTGGGGIAASYMNPYLKNVLDPQLAEMRRNAQINNLSGIGAMTKAGAFGGGRQAIMQSEANQNLLAEQNKTIGQGYSNAYDRGMNQFNTEQKQSMDLVDLMSKQGAVDRGITSEEIAAKKKQFEEARLNPYKMVQFQQSLLSGLPLESTSYNQSVKDSFTQFAEKYKTIEELLTALGQ